MHVLNGRARRSTRAPLRAVRVGALLMIIALGVSVTLPVQAAPLPQAALAAITTPTDGQELRGNVTITGSAAHPDFERYELAYGPDPNPNDAWQTFGGNNQPVTNGALGIWNTNVVADGTYIIRLRVIRKDSNYAEAFARGLKVSNQQPVGTPTSIPPAPTFGSEATPAPSNIILVEQPPTSEPTSSANAANTQTVSNTTSRQAGNATSSSSSTTFTGLISSACLTGLGWTLVAFILLGAIAFSRSQTKHFRRHRRKKLSDADSQSTPPAAA